MKRAVALAAVLGFAACAHAQKPCPPAEAAKAEKTIDTVVSWAQMRKVYVDYAHCNTGAVADMYCDALLRLMVEWKNIDALAADMAKDEKYRDFVYAHLRSPAAKDDRETVYLRAKGSCPKGLDAFCAELANVVNPTAAPAPPEPPARPAPAASPAPPAPGK